MSHPKRQMSPKCRPHDVVIWSATPDNGIKPESDSVNCQGCDGRQVEGIASRKSEHKNKPAWYLNNKQVRRETKVLPLLLSSNGRWQVELCSPVLEGLVGRQ